MFNELKNLLKHSTIYSAGNILNRSISFLLLPLYTHYLTTAQYGTLEIIELTSYIAGMFISFGIGQSVTRFYYEHTDARSRDQIISSALIAISLFALAAVSLLVLLSGDLSRLIFKTSGYAALLNIMFFSLLFSLLGEIPFIYMRIKEKSFLYIAFSLVKTIATLALNIAFVVVFELGIVGILLSSCITGGLQCAALVVLTFREVKFGFSQRKVLDMLKYGLPFVPGGLGMFVLNFGDRFFLQKFSDLSVVGIYSLGYKFGMTLHFLIFDPFMSIWGPKRFEFAKQDHGSEMIARIFTYLCFIELFAGLGLSLLIKDVVKIISSPEYETAYRIVPVIVLSYIFLAAYFYVQIGILVEKKTKYIPFVVVIGAALNTLLCFLLIPRYHDMGAAYATLVSFLVMFLINYLISGRFLKIPYEFARITKMAAVAAALYIVFSTIPIESRGLSIMVKSLGALVFPFALLFLNFYSDAEISKIKGIVFQFFKFVRAPAIKLK